MTKNLGINGKEPQPWKIGTYEKTQVGAFITPNNIWSCEDPFTALPYANEALGVKAEKGNFFAAAEIGAGTSATAKIETGYEVPIGKNFGLEVSADARVAQSLIGTKIEISNAANVNEQMVVSDPYHQATINNALTAEDNNKVLRYKDSSMAAGMDVMAKWHSNDKLKLTFGLGARAAVVSANAAHVSQELNVGTTTAFIECSMPDGFYNNAEYTGAGNISANTTIGEKHTQFIVSPVVEMKVKPGKWEVGGKFSFDEARIEGVYKFK